MSNDKIKKPLEKDIVRECCEYLASYNFFFWRSNNLPVFSFGGRGNNLKPRFRSMPKYSIKGLPDIIIVSNGLMIGIEVKVPGRKLRPEQAEFATKLIMNGGLYFTVHSCIELKESLRGTYSIWMGKKEN